MPIIVSEETFTRPLKTAPPDGYVVIRRMNHGEKLLRSEFATKMTYRVAGNGRNKRDMEGTIELMQRASTLWDFKHLIVDHNLQDVDGRELNFKNEADINKIPGIVGEEISSHLDELNNFEADAEDEDTDLGK
jgi:hypothetical protein